MTKRIEAVVMLALGFACGAFAAGRDDGKNTAGMNTTITAKPGIQLMYPQVGFWESEVMIEGSDERIAVSSDRFRELMKQTPKGIEYLDSYNFKQFMGWAGALGGLGVVVIGPSIALAMPDRETTAIVALVSGLAALGLEVAGIIVYSYSFDDYYRAILEYNRTQVNKACVSAAGWNAAVLGYNFRF
jgi:hypothetical protein